MTKTKAFAGLLAIGALAIAGCGGGGGGGMADTSDTSPKTSTAAESGAKAPDAKVSIVKPQDGATTSSTVTANVNLEGFELNAASVGKAAKAGQGHLHFSMDDGKFDQPKYSGENGKLAVKLGVQGKYSPAVMPTITYKGLPPGEHTLKVFVVNNDHSETGTEAETTFTVER